MKISTMMLAISMVALVHSHAAFAADAIAIRPSGSGESIVLSPGRVSPHKVFLLDKPDRLVVDVPGFASAGTALPDNYKGHLIRKLRTGRFNPTTTRVVFDLNERITVAVTREKNNQLIIDIVPAGENARPQSEDATPPFTGTLFGNTEKPKIEPVKPGKDQIDPTAGIAREDKADKQPEEKPRKKDKARKETEKEPEKIPEKKSRPEKSDKPEKADKPEKPDKSAKSDKKAAKPKGEKPTVVIDPGHGGIDPGTAGTSGTVEKMLVLEYGQALKNKLLKSGRYQVFITRDHDEFIMLRHRVEIARNAGADIFISLHADSAPGAARGLSVYTVSEQASDDEAEKLAARENKADVLAGINLANEREDVAGILISLAERDTKNRSATLADMLVTSLDDKVHLLPESHRFAGFAVLKAPDIPSVLIEIGFLSNPQEEKLIKSKTYRDRVISGIAAGVDKYFKFEKRGEDL